jgi:hypothetical protein
MSNKSLEDFFSKEIIGKYNEDKNYKIEDTIIKSIILSYDEEKVNKIVKKLSLVGNINELFKDDLKYDYCYYEYAPNLDDKEIMENLQNKYVKTIFESEKQNVGNVWKLFNVGKVWKLFKETKLYSMIINDYGLKNIEDILKLMLNNYELFIKNTGHETCPCCEVANSNKIKFVYFVFTNIFGTYKTDDNEKYFEICNKLINLIDPREEGGNSTNENVLIRACINTKKKNILNKIIHHLKYLKNSGKSYGWRTIYPDNETIEKLIIDYRLIDIITLWYTEDNCKGADIGKIMEKIVFHINDKSSYRNVVKNYDNNELINSLIDPILVLIKNNVGLFDEGYNNKNYSEIIFDFLLNKIFVDVNGLSLLEKLMYYVNDDDEKKNIIIKNIIKKMIFKNHESKNYGIDCDISFVDSYLKENYKKIYENEYAKLLKSITK